MRAQTLSVIICLSVFATCQSSGQAIRHQPFSAPSKANGNHQGFTLLSPSITGLIADNQYDDPKMWGHRYREFMGGGMGSGVAAGDFDNDGKVDLYVSLKTKPGRLFRNLGNWKFKDVTEEAEVDEDGSMLDWLSSAFSDDEVIWRQGAVFADIDNDGWLDLYVCRNNAPNLLYMNQRNGRFREEGEKRGLGIVDGSVVGAFADYDRDGWLDVLVLTNQVEGTEPEGRQDRLFRNRGDGTYTEVTQSAGIAGPTFGHAATWFDYDEDGWPDFYLANDFSGADYLYRNNQDGTFTNVLNETAPHTPYSSMGADTADINNDGHIDLLVADMATTQREKNQRGLVSSRSDVLSVGTTDGVAPQYTRNALLLNSGLGVFGEAASWAGLEATDWTWSIRFEDFDSDGWVDLHVTNGMVREANNSDLLNRMMRALSDMQRIAVIKRAPTLAESNLAYRNRNGEGFEQVTEKWGLSDVGVSFGAATADFDKDGDLDLAYLDYNGGLKVYRNDFAGQNRIQIRLQGEKSNRNGVGAVVRIKSATIGQQTRTLTVARGYAAGSELIVHFGLGPDQNVDRVEIEWPSGIAQTFQGLTANHAYTITETDQEPQSTHETTALLFSDASSSLIGKEAAVSTLTIPDKEQALIPFRTDRSSPSVIAADFNGDDLEDLFIGAEAETPAQLFLQQKTGGFSASPSSFPIPKGLSHGPALAFDADADGDRDLLLTLAGSQTSDWPSSYRPQLFLNEGGNRFKVSSNALPPIALNAGAATASDIDGDGDLDLFLGGRSIPGRYPESPNSYLLLNDEGVFNNVTQSQASELSAVGLVKSALFHDLNQDGSPDLIVALEWDYVRCFINDGRGHFTDQSETFGFKSGGKGWWNGLAAADLNGDGLVDFVAGNLGLNTTYHASENEPATLFYGQFGQSSNKAIVEAVYDNGKLYPLRSRGDLGANFPSVLRKYPKNDDFARASLNDVFGEDALDKALRFEAQNFQSGVFISQPDGYYRFAPLPAEAQIGPLIGPVLDDFDGDGTLDLVATQNSDVAIPRFHGGLGLFLSGVDNGSFRVVRPSTSAIAFPESGRAIVSLDINQDQRPDFYYSRHGKSGILMVNQSTASDGLAIELEGTYGNLDAVGARITLHFLDGKSQVREIGIGGGWQSQSSTRLFLSEKVAETLRKVEVRWPDGSISVHPIEKHSGIWQLKPLRKH